MTTVLVIDDDDAVRVALGRVLQRAGFAVRTADSGAASLQALREEPADVIITDIIMAGIDGVETIRAIAKEFPQVRVVAISGGGNYGVMAYKPDALTTSAYLAAAREAGAHAILTKPFETRELLETIRMVQAGRPDTL